MDRTTIRMSGPLLALMLLVPSSLVPPGAQAQEEAATVEVAPRPVASAGFRLGPVADGIRIMPGGWLALAIGDRTTIGAGGFRLPTSSTVELAPGSPLELEFGYAGVLIERRHHYHSGFPLVFRGLIGAGHASVRPNGSMGGIDADNFAVVEGGLAFEWLSTTPLKLSLGGGYRRAVSVQDLLGIEARHLSAPFASFDVRITIR